MHEPAEHGREHGSLRSQVETVLPVVLIRKHSSHGQLCICFLASQSKTRFSRALGYVKVHF